jgi:predicted DNA-binding transcriptional regulator YafY
LPLHRFISVKTIPEKIEAPERYDINSVSAQRSLISLESDVPVLLCLLLSQEMCERLAENPLTEDQHLFDINGCRTMEGSTHLSQGLELWLLSQGDHLEVLEPSTLREKMAATVKRMAALYLNN